MRLRSLLPPHPPVCFLFPFSFFLLPAFFLPPSSYLLPPSSFLSARLSQSSSGRLSASWQPSCSHVTPSPLGLTCERTPPRPASLPIILARSRIPHPASHTQHPSWPQRCPPAGQNLIVPSHSGTTQAPPPYFLSPLGMARFGLAWLGQAYSGSFRLVQAQLGSIG